MLTILFSVGAVLLALTVVEGVDGGVTVALGE